MTRRRQSTILLTLALVIGVSRMASAQDQFTCMRDTFGTMSVTPDVITEGFLRHVFLSWSVTVPQGCSGLVRIALNSSEVPASGTRLLYPTTTAYFQLQVRWYTSSTFQTIRIVPVLVVPRIRTDLLLQRSDGQVLIQLMKGVQSQGAAFPQVADPTWHIQGTGDFNRDGEADIVWRQPNGQVVIWLMRDAEVLYERTPASIGTLWRMGGIGDFNRDGHADILWRHSNGATRIWLMSNAALVTQTQPGTRPPTVSIQGLGDFDSDGDSDIMWRGANGQVSLWYMSDGLRVGQASPGVVDPAVWSVQSIGDLNGDGASDVLWRDTEGQLALWFSADPNTVVYPAYQNVPGAVMDTSWRVLGLADFNADGRADILWLSPQSVMNIWIMNGGQFVSEHFAGVLGLDWSLKGLLRQAIPLPTPWPFPGPVVIDAATP